MRTYQEVLKELREKGIKPYDPESSFYDFNEWEGSPLKQIIEDFFSFGQEYLDRKDLGFSIDPARLYFSANTTLNALARKLGDYYLVEVYVGAINYMKEFYLSKEEKFNEESIAPYKEICQARNVSPGFLMLQLATIYFLYHEVGHLIQRSTENADHAEFSDHECKGDEIKIHHMKELDADWHSAHCMAMHIKQFAEYKDGDQYKVEPNVLSDIASLGLAAIFIYFIDRTDKNPKLYYEEKCHPHPLVRLSYMIIFFLQNLQGNVDHGLDQGTLIKNAILISEILMKENGDNIVEKYSKALYENSKDIEKYIHQIMGNAEQYPKLCKHILKSEK